MRPNYIAKKKYYLIKLKEKYPIKPNYRIKKKYYLIKFEKKSAI